MISRRNFVKLAGAVPLMPLSAPERLGEDLSYASPNPAKGAVIKRFSIFNSSGSFYRFVGMNAYDKAPKGIKGVRKSCKVELSDGTVGLGTVGYSSVDDAVLSKIKQLIGKDLFTFYQWKDDQITGVVPAMQAYFFNTQYAWVESAILDAIGKIKQQPVWRLMGESVRKGIDPYDGTLYFEDITHHTDARIIGEIGKRMKADGYRAIKIKLGRPFKWMPGEAGVNRDIEAFIALREAVGENFHIMADANNGYQDKFDWAVKLMKSCAPHKVYFMEELFPDDVQLYLRLREELLKEGFFIPVAEGENIHELEKFDQYGKDGVYNYIQPDMATCGFSYVLHTAKKAEKYPHVKLIPHVWQSQFGLIMSLHAAKIQLNINHVEDSRYFEHVFIPSGYLFTEGQWFVPDKPGWGIELSPDYQQFLTDDEVIIS